MADGVAIFSPDGRFVLTGCEDGLVRLWDAHTGQLVMGPLPQGNRIRSLAFAPDSKSFLAGGGARDVRLFHVDQPKAAAVFPAGSEVWSLAFRAQDGKVLTAGYLGAVALWDPLNPKDPLWRAEHANLIFAAAISPDGRFVLAGSTDGTGHLLDARSGKPCAPVLQHGGQITAVAFSPDSKIAVTAGANKGVGLWDVATGQRLGDFLPHQGWINNLVFSPDGKFLVSAGMSRAALLWDVASRRPHCAPLAHQARLYAVAFHPNGKLPVTGSGDRTAQLWHVATCRPVGPPILHQNQVGCAVISPDGKTVLTGSEDKTARLTPLPSSWERSVDDTLLWVQAVTGLELDAHGAVRSLGREAWEELPQRWQQRPLGALKKGAPETMDQTAGSG
jgi:hypothetical protein